MLDAKGCVEIGKVSLKELKLTLEGFAKVKSLGHNGWTYEFFVELFYLVGEDLLKVVKESRK